MTLRSLPKDCRVYARIVLCSECGRSVCRRGERTLMHRGSCDSRRKSSHIPEWTRFSPSSQTSRDENKNRLTPQSPPSIGEKPAGHRNESDAVNTPTRSARVCRPTPLMRFSAPVVPGVPDSASAPDLREQSPLVQPDTIRAGLAAARAGRDGSYPDGSPSCRTPRATSSCARPAADGHSPPSSPIRPRGSQ
jgi:hypothetical protein